MSRPARSNQSAVGWRKFTASSEIQDSRFRDSGFRDSGFRDSGFRIQRFRGLRPKV
jgi:hypothetical protein